MSYNEYAEFVQFAHTLAHAAGDIVRRHFHTPLTVETKADASPVTLADRESENAMRALIEARYPRHGILGEEFGTRNEQAPWQWVLDPIDGTRAFIAGYPTFTILISLVKDGVPVLGIIDQPTQHERWVGVAGEKTTSHNRPLMTRNTRMLAQSMLATTSTDYFTPGQAEAFARLKPQCKYTTLSGDAYAYAMLASGKIDVVVDAGLKPFDFCALVPVIQGAGGIITDWGGNAVTLKSDGRVLAAANAELHQQALKLLHT